MQLMICGPNLRDQSKGDFHVHAAGCADLRNYGGRGKNLGGETPWPLNADDRLEVVEAVYSDIIEERGPIDAIDAAHELLSDFHFAPCCSALPKVGERSESGRPAKDSTGGDGMPPKPEEALCRGGHFPVSEYGEVCPSCLVDAAEPAWRTPFCSCPAEARGPWDCLDCPEHGKEAAEAVEAEHRSEVLAEGAWLRAAENAMEPCPEWAR